MREYISGNFVGESYVIKDIRYCGDALDIRPIRAELPAIKRCHLRVLRLRLQHVVISLRPIAVPSQEKQPLQLHVLRAPFGSGMLKYATFVV